MDEQAPSVRPPPRQQLAVGVLVGPNRHIWGYAYIFLLIEHYNSWFYNEYNKYRLHIVNHDTYTNFLAFECNFIHGECNTTARMHGLTALGVNVSRAKCKLHALSLGVKNFIQRNLQVCASLNMGETP
jgi:hypothetical protein